MSDNDNTLTSSGLTYTTSTEPPVPFLPLYKSLNDQNLARFTLLASPTSDSVNYPVWVRRMTSALRAQLLWTIVTGARTRPTPASGAAAMAAWEADDESAIEFIISKLEDEEVERVDGCATSKNMWDTLREAHQLGGSLGEGPLLEQLIAMRYNEGLDMHQHVDAFRNKVRAIKRCKADLEHQDTLFGILLLGTLSETPGPSLLKTHIRAQVGRDAAGVPNKLTFDYVSKSLIEDAQLHAATTRSNPSASSGAVLAITPIAAKCYWCGGTGHFAAKCPDMLKGKPKSGGGPSSGERKWCTHHNSTSHNSEDCFVLKEKEKEKENGSVNALVETEKDTTYEAVFSISSTPTTVALIDSACS